MDEIKEILKRDIKERLILQEGIAQMRRRQISMIVIGVLIFLMFFANYSFLVRQNNKQEAIIKALMEVRRLESMLTDSTINDTIK